MIVIWKSFWISEGRKLIRLQETLGWRVKVLQWSEREGGEGGGREVGAEGEGGSFWILEGRKLIRLQETLGWRVKVLEGG
jgi:hypothetical protein